MPKKQTTKKKAKPKITKQKKSSTPPPSVEARAPVTKKSGKRESKKTILLEKEVIKESAITTEASPSSTAAVVTEEKKPSSEPAVLVKKKPKARAKSAKKVEIESPPSPPPSAAEASPEVAVSPPAPKDQPVPIEAAPPMREISPAIAAPKPQIAINETITVKDLAEKMNLKVGDVLMRLLKSGTRASINQRLDVDTATLLAGEFGFDAKFVPLYSEEAMLKAEEEETGQLLPRSPIVTIMGHVDHGKTTLLDAIRQSDVAEKEAGGITQHIGAYKVHMEKGSIVFLDTPGHEAFTAMRARGAQATDLVVLVVAADDGVMPQTVEAIDHARAANVPILVAINKMDLPGASPDRVKQELSRYQLSPEEWGGKTIFVEVSAKKKTNIDKLLEMILLEAELMELKANPHRPAQGVVIEARLDPKKGSVATVLVQKGTLKVGQTFVCGLTSGKVRSLTDDHGLRILEAGPSTPVEVLGFSETPQLGERIIVVSSEREAREIAERRKELMQTTAMRPRRHLSLETLSQVAKEGKIKELNLILKADVQGSLEAVKDSIEKISNQEIRLKVIHAGVGGVTESDVSLAAASDAVIIGFNVRPEPQGEELAKREGVEIKSYRIIYEAVADIRAAMEGLLTPEEKEMSIGRVEIREIFKTPAGKIAGSMVVKGKVSRNAKVRLLRDAKIIYEGQIASLRRFKEDVREVEEGYECGIALENFQEIEKGDILEVFTIEKRAKKLE